MCLKDLAEDTYYLLILTTYFMFAAAILLRNVSPIIILYHLVITKTGHTYIYLHRHFSCLDLKCFVQIGHGYRALCDSVNRFAHRTVLQTENSFI